MDKEKSIVEKTDALLEKTPENRPSYFQIQHFILGKQPTIQSQMWQCLRELKTRRKAIDSIRMELEEIDDQLLLLDIEKEREKKKINSTDLLSEREYKIKLRQLNRKCHHLGKTADELKEKLKTVEQECQFIIQYFEALLKVEPLKDYDDLDVQKEYWNEKFTEEINLRILLGQQINTELAKEVLALNEDAPVKIELQNLLEKIKNQASKKEIQDEMKARSFLQDITQKLIEEKKNA